jgi:hypothetical protein
VNKPGPTSDFVPGDRYSTPPSPYESGYESPAYGANYPYPGGHYFQPLSDREAQLPSVASPYSSSAHNQPHIARERQLLDEWYGTYNPDTTVTRSALSAGSSIVLKQFRIDEGAQEFDPYHRSNVDIAISSANKHPDTRIEIPSRSGSTGNENDRSFDRPSSRAVSNEWDEYVPTSTRKRSRIPHTAVERRYRESINAHLDRLRCTIPTLTQGSTAVPTDDSVFKVKPCKYQILNGTIQHINALDKEVNHLKTEKVAPASNPLWSQYEVDISKKRKREMSEEGDDGNNITREHDCSAHKSLRVEEPWALDSVDDLLRRWTTVEA